MSESFLTLSKLEVFFVSTTIVSLVFNILQWREARASRDPLSNALVATFNDIKLKINNVIFTYAALFNQNSPHKDVRTLQWEYGLFVQDINAFLQGIQEQLVGVLVSLRPADKEGRQAFRASEYGLSEQDKRLRQKSLEQYLAGMRTDNPPPPAVGAKEPGL